MKKIILVLSILSVISGCGGPTDSTTNKHSKQSGGQFSISKLHESNTRIMPNFKIDISQAPNLMVNPIESISFDLGDIKSSQQFNFILTNAGDEKITSINLTSTNPNFKITPSSISRIDPFNEASLLNVIKVSALHGTALNGVGFIDLMPMGINDVEIGVIGVTVKNGVTENVSLTLNVEVKALVADIEVSTNGVTRNFSFITQKGIETTYGK